MTLAQGPLLIKSQLKYNIARSQPNLEQPLLRNRVIVNTYYLIAQDFQLFHYSIFISIFMITLIKYVTHDHLANQI